MAINQWSIRKGYFLLHGVFFSNPALASRKSIKSRKGGGRNCHFSPRKQPYPSSQRILRSSN
ncbi:uncharacterized protein G2W53_001721 [Senna tora]|uniref:Uncharacterized protein n=1 Tax=Senna tora TaxID=362788 RepID=A0A835CKJ8_9FABA|nr:uncharacterized protein G2W53_001721 [Senna tora]